MTSKILLLICFVLWIHFLILLTPFRAFAFCQHFVDQSYDMLTDKWHAKRGVAEEVKVDFLSRVQANPNECLRETSSFKSSANFMTIETQFRRIYFNNGCRYQRIVSVSLSIGCRKQTWDIERIMSCFKSAPVLNEMFRFDTTRIYIYHGIKGGP